MGPQDPWKTKGFGHLKTRLLTIKISRHVGLGCSWGTYTSPMDPMASPLTSTQAVDLLQANHVVLVQVAPSHQAIGEDVSVGYLWQP